MIADGIQFIAGTLGLTGSILLQLPFFREDRLRRQRSEAEEWRQTLPPGDDPAREGLGMVQDSVERDLTAWSARSYGQAKWDLRLLIASFLLTAGSGALVLRLLSGILEVDAE